MSIMKFDTFNVIKELQGYGFEPRQAEGVVEALKKATEAGSEDLATKGDLAMVRGEIKDLDAKIDKVELSLSGKIDTLRAEMTSLKWILGVLTAAVFSLVAKAFLFP
ncbi:MAG: CCDC90 family protein [Helicobacteraceae bacterium]|nr:CCDC90 family protein [Helicobacteraceae bacterium]